MFGALAAPVMQAHLLPLYANIGPKSTPASAAHSRMQHPEEETCSITHLTRLPTAQRKKINSVTRQCFSPTTADAYARRPGTFQAVLGLALRTMQQHVPSATEYHGAACAGQTCCLYARTGTRSSTHARGRGLLSHA
jgi:hypothetical protein